MKRHPPSAYSIGVAGRLGTTAEKSSQSLALFSTLERLAQETHGLCDDRSSDRVTQYLACVLPLHPRAHTPSAQRRPQSRRCGREAANATLEIRPWVTMWVRPRRRGCGPRRAQTCNSILRWTAASRAAPALSLNERSLSPSSVWRAQCLTQRPSLDHSE